MRGNAPKVLLLERNLDVEPVLRPLNVKHSIKQPFHAETDAIFQVVEILGQGFPERSIKDL